MTATKQSANSTTSLPDGLNDCLLWSEEAGMGWHPRPPMNYDGSYFQHYRELDATETGAALTKARVDMVRRHYDGTDVVDVGIGGGRFVEAIDGFGYDINQDAVGWLGGEGRYREPSACALTFWDSLEHIPAPDRAVDAARDWVFVSMPIYSGVSDVLSSKHYKPGEHIWYWTRDGLIRWFHRLGFFCVEVNSVENELGREGILSFAFRRG